MFRLIITAIVLSVSFGLPVATAAEPEGTDVRLSDFDTLRTTLMQHGWRVERAENGDMLVYPPTADDAAESSAGTGSSTSEPERVETTDLSRLEAIARQRGWQVERDENGGLLLYPKIFLDDDRSANLAAAKKAGKDVASPLEGAIGASETERLQKALQARGWQTGHAENGDLLLFPVTEENTPVTVQTIPLAHCLEGGSRKLHIDNLTLPLDDKLDAGRIARAWIEQDGSRDLLVGRIHHLGNVYLVDVVTAGKARTLKGQLLIDGRNGALIPIL